MSGCCVISHAEFEERYRRFQEAFDETFRRILAGESIRTVTIDSAVAMAEKPWPNPRPLEIPLYTIRPIGRRLVMNEVVVPEDDVIVPLAEHTRMPPPTELAAFRALTCCVEPGEHGEGVERPATAKDVREHMEYLQREWDAAERRRVQPPGEAANLLEEAWGLIANASQGDWERESPEWQIAAARWRARYHALFFPGRTDLVKQATRCKGLPGHRSDCECATL